MQVCQPQSSVEVRCQLPAVNIPLQLQPSLDTDLYTPSSSYGTAPTHRPLPSNETRTCLLSPVTSAPVEVGNLTVKFGLIFDGLMNYSDYGMLSLLAPPRFCFNDTLLTYKVHCPVYIQVTIFSLVMYEYKHS